MRGMSFMEPRTKHRSKTPKTRNTLSKVIRSFWSSIKKRDEKELASLVSQLKSRNPMERKQAESELEKESRQAKPYLESLLAEPNIDFSTRFSAVRLLGRMEGPGGIKQLPYPVMVDRPQPSKARVDPTIIQELEESLRRTTDPKVRKSITEALDKIRRAQG